MNAQQRHVARQTPLHGRINMAAGSLLDIPIADAEREAVALVEQMRPSSLRTYDQIPMLGDDLIRQAKLIGHQLAGRAVAFVGDHDGTSLLLGLLANLGSVRAPSQMHVLDFDERLLYAAERLAGRGGFGHLFETTLYNAFDPVPAHLVGQFDWFYTNPPYGQYNTGASARLFITRGIELVHRKQGARGCLLLPDDEQRSWTERAMFETQAFLTDHGWFVEEKLKALHGYHLDDDMHLTSSMMVVKQGMPNVTRASLPWAGRRVNFVEVPAFYGRSVASPYPRYIRADGYADYEWT